MLLSIENNHNILVIVTCLIKTNRSVYKFRSGTKLPRWAIVAPFYGNVKGYVCKNTVTDHYTVIFTLNKAKNGNINLDEIVENKKI